jgi:hypothetical protein
MRSVAVKDRSVKVTSDEWFIAEGLSEVVMKIQKALLIGLFATASMGGLSVPSVASADVSLYFGIAPPPSRYERVPAPRRGYVWINGYWDVKRHRHVWHQGHWERARRGYHYAQPAWAQRNNRWELQRGEWRRGDQDRDGIPNRYDRDRDGDGRNNWRDDSPNNPRRR